MIPNPAYPDQKPEDFADFYDPETSGYPWDTLTYCCVCHRNPDKFNNSCNEFRLWDNARNKYIWFVSCSPQCRQAKRDYELAQAARWHAMQQLQRA
jgi:hypothetical protein